VTVTIYTDASIKRNRGAWACVVLRDGERHEGFGVLRGDFRSSTATELCAIANALHFADKVASLRGGRVELWCDNIPAVMHANRQAKVRLKLDERMKESRRWIRDFVKTHRIEFRAYHIPGHQRLDSDDPGAIYNIRCDELCSAVRDMMEAAPFDALEARIAKAKARAAAGQGSKREKVLWAAE